MWQDLQKMCKSFYGHLFMNHLMVFLTLSSFFSNVEAQDRSETMPQSPQNSQPTRVSTEMVIVILSITFTITFVLLSYVKFCRTNPFELLNRDMHPQNFPRLTQSGWPRFSGIDKQVIEALPVIKFSSLKGSKEGLECVVCLSKFHDTETLRLLPKCKHAFHTSCIDKWLESHSSCPLCRSRIDQGDIKSFTSSFSSSFLRVPSNLTEEPSLEICVQREQSRQASLRFNAGSGLWNVDKCKKEELLIDSGGNWEILPKFNHKIVISGFVTRSRWSDLNSTDLLSLNSEMLNVMSSRRFFPSESTKGESSLRSSTLPSTSNEEQNSFKLLNCGGKRSVSEIPNVPRFAEISRIKKLVASGENNGKEERFWRIWLPIAQRTVQGFARRERSSTEIQDKQLASSV